MKSVNTQIEKLRGRHAEVIQTENCRRSAVCVPLIEKENGPELLFEVRSPRIKTQPGDICFPGGRLEEGETALTAALRETCEELCVDPSQLAPVCPLDTFCDGCLMINAFLARVSGYDGSFSPQEVSEVFTVPLSRFTENEPQRHTIELVHLKSETFPYHLINGGENYRFRRRFDDELFYICRDTGGKERVIWGITARIIKNLITLIQ